MSAARRPVSVLIAALGGQGGGVLTEWIVDAATHAGLRAQATSIPGVAQRTGATTYYLEIYPEPLPAGSPEPVFSLYPMPGDVDVIMASELLEAGRTIEMDYASPDRTTLIASTHRLFAIAEKSALGNGTFPRERVEEAARALTKRLIACDALAVARAAGSEVNAVLMGALAAAGALPLVASDFEAAIREGGVAVERNLAGFKAGMEVAAGATGPEAARVKPWAELKNDRAHALGTRGRDFLALIARIESEYPAALHQTLGEAAARLIDYQDAHYAERFLARVRLVRVLDTGTRLTERFARRLAVWMSYEDAIRVADLKTRHSRFERPGADGDGLSQARPRRDLRHLPGVDRRRHRPLGREALARRAADPDPARQDHFGAGLPARVGAWTAAVAPALIAPRPARVCPSRPLAAGGAGRGCPRL
jgi:indolepyruvate ferredoxin oxidoreductase beta subunit